MKDEVKLIIEKLKILSTVKENGLCLCDKENSKILLDYITNLQEELEGYKQERERILNKLDYVKKNKDLQEELDRCVKANVIFDNENTELQGKIIILQEENERLKKPDYYEKGLIGSIKERDEIIQDYKSKIDKVIKNSQMIIDLGFDYDGFNDEENLKKLIDGFVKLANDNIIILRGEENENI